MRTIKLYQLLELIDNDQMTDIYFKDRIIWSGKKKEMKDIMLGDCFVESINIDKASYPRLEIYMSAECE